MKLVLEKTILLARDKYNTESYKKIGYSNLFIEIERNEMVFTKNFTMLRNL